MALVVLIETPEKLDDYVERDMRRWWRDRCQKRTRPDGEVFFVVPGKLNLYGGVERLASFGVKARVARRDYVSSPTYL